MARRTIEQRIRGLFGYALGMVLIAVALVIIIVREYPLEAVGLALAVVALAIFLRRRAGRKSELDCGLAERCADRLLERHRSELISYYRQSIRPHPFGGEDASLWRRHIESFLDAQVVPALSAASVRLTRELGAHLADYVDGWIRSESARAGTIQSIDPAKLTGLEYEQYCALILADGGWIVRQTPVTGDHGADIIAEKDGRRLAVQCKLYAQPVGNKAVQEVHSARSLYHCDYACVVASSDFTKQAQREAHAHGIQLLHHTRLASFAVGLSKQMGLPFEGAAIA